MFKKVTIIAAAISIIGLIIAGIITANSTISAANINATDINSSIDKIIFATQTAEVKNTEINLKISQTQAAIVPIVLTGTNISLVNTPSYSPFPSNSPSYTNVETPTQTPIIQPTINKDDWQLIFNDEFNNNQNGWTQKGSDDNLSWDPDINNGKYKIELIAKRDNVWSTFVPVMDNINNFYYAADIKLINPPLNNTAALIFRRVDVMDYYTFEITEPDLFRIRLFTHDKWTELLSWTPSQFIKKGDKNHLVVIGIGAKFQFYINGMCVKKIENTQFPIGKIGILGRLSKVMDVLDIEVDNIEVRLPEDFGNSPCP